MLAALAGDIAADNGASVRDNACGDLVIGWRDGWRAWVHHPVDRLRSRDAAGCNDGYRFMLMTYRATIARAAFASAAVSR